VSSSSSMILKTISSIAGVGGIRAYISTRLRKSSMDSSKSTSASCWELAPLAAWFIWTSERYLCRSWRRAHTANRIARPVRIAFAGGYCYRNRSGMWKRAIEAFLRTRPMASPNEVVEERVNNNDTVLSIEFIILAVRRRSLDARASYLRITVMFSMEQTMEWGFWS